MAKGKKKHDWEIASQILSEISLSARKTPKSAAEFNPFSEGIEKTKRIGISSSSEWHNFCLQFADEKQKKEITKLMDKNREQNK